MEIVETMQLLQHGLGLVPVALAINRITVGTFFVLSGYQKLFKPGRHDELVSTLQADGALRGFSRQFTLCYPCGNHLVP
jgi:uncharacterized membrane protein YphA (DoxX/SURF4 family)